MRRGRECSDVWRQLQANCSRTVCKEVQCSGVFITGEESLTGGNNKNSVIYIRERIGGESDLSFLSDLNNLFIYFFLIKKIESKILIRCSRPDLIGRIWPNVFACCSRHKGVYAIHLILISVVAAMQWLDQLPVCNACTKAVRTKTGCNIFGAQLFFISSTMCVYTRTN